ncbi:NADH-quinone oxidoreductase subunit N [Thalassotalea fusca]
MSHANTVALAWENLVFALPVLTIAIGVVLVMILAGWRRSNVTPYIASQMILLIAILLALIYFPPSAIHFTTLVKLEKVSATLFIIICFTALAILKIAREQLNGHIEAHEEYYILFLLVILGASTLIMANHFATLFLGFELMSIALVGLIGYLKQQNSSVEASFKYLILSAAASSFMLLGIALLYAYSGTLYFDGSPLTISTSLHANASELPPLVLSLGCLLFFSGLAFKISLVPFHYWTPDVYAGAPTSVTLLLATISKLAIFTGVLKCSFSPLFHGYFLQPQVYSVFVGLAILSIIVGNVLALQQRQLKRILAFSSIAHMGYLMILVFVASSNSVSLAWQAMIFYFVAYLLASVALFYFINVAEHNNGGEQVVIDDFKGLFWRSPYDALLIIISLLSLAGIPLTAGFIGKFYLVTFASFHALWLLLGAIVVGSTISLAYYLPVIFALFGARENIASVGSVKVSSPVFVIVMILASLYLGVLPGEFSEFLAWL